MLDDMKTFQFDNNIYLKREELRKQFLNKFPLEKLENMTLQEYIEKENKETFT